MDDNHKNQIAHVEEENKNSDSKYKYYFFLFFKTFFISL
jgi:hypothetical protein